MESDKVELDDQKVAALPNGEYRMVVIGGVLFGVAAEFGKNRTLRFSAAA